MAQTEELNVKYSESKELWKVIWHLVCVLMHRFEITIKNLFHLSKWQATRRRRAKLINNKWRPYSNHKLAPMMDFKKTRRYILQDLLRLCKGETYPVDWMAQSEVVGSLGETLDQKLIKWSVRWQGTAPLEIPEVGAGGGSQTENSAWMFNDPRAGTINLTNECSGLQERNGTPSDTANCWILYFRRLPLWRVKGKLFQ